MTRLTKVVLPAPLGPISAWRAPRSSRKSMSFATVQRAEALAQAARLERRSDGAASLIAASRDAPPRRASITPEHAAAREHHHQHQQQADPEIPVDRIDLGEAVLRDHVERHADEGAIEPPDAAQDQHDDDVAGAVEAQHIERDELRRLRRCSAPATPAIAAEIV